jgi:alpha-mannosidase II
MIKHKTMDKIPLQANFYPLPSMAYIEDDNYRFSILSGQSLGMASLNVGKLFYVFLILLGAVVVVIVW